MRCIEDLKIQYKCACAYKNQVPNTYCKVKKERKETEDIVITDNVWQRNKLKKEAFASQGTNIGPKIYLPRNSPFLECTCTMYECTIVHYRKYKQVHSTLCTSRYIIETTSTYLQVSIGKIHTYRYLHKRIFSFIPLSSKKVS